MNTKLQNRVETGSVELVYVAYVKEELKRNATLYGYLYTLNDSTASEVSQTVRSAHSSSLNNKLSHLMG